MKTQTSMKLAAAQIQSAISRRMDLLKDDPIKRNEHFKKYNINASTYDEAYVRAYGEEYLGYLTEQVRAVADQKVDLVLFPEFTFMPGVLAGVHPTIPLNPRARADAIKLYKWSSKLFIGWLCRQAKATKMLIAATTTTVRGRKLYNTGLLADERGRLVLRYEKIHLPFDEIESFSVGRDYNVADTRLGRIAFSICYDLQFPEHQACLAVRGAQIVLHPSGGYHGADEAKDLAQNRLRIRASDHHMAMVYTCFALDNGGCEESAVISPNGDVKAFVPGNQIGFAIAEVAGVGKWVWPGDKPTDPDRTAFRRQFRRTETYRPLLVKSKKP